VASDAAKIVRKLRALSQTATAELRDNLGPGFEDLQPSDLNPKKFIKKQFSDVLKDEEDESAKMKPQIDPDLL
jgi:sec-independent protein translocase protein TatB